MKILVFILATISVLLFGMYCLNAAEYNNIFQHSYINNDGSVAVKEQVRMAKSKVPMTRFINKCIADTILTDANVEAQCRQFIANNSTMNVDNMQLLAAKFRGNQWYVNFAQTHNNIRVLNANTKLRIFENGNLLYVETAYFPEITHHSELHRVNDVDTNSMKQVSIAAIEKINSIENLAFTFGEQYIFAVPTKNRTDFYLLQSVEFRNTLGDIAYRSYIDVKSNKLFLRYNLVHNANYTIKSKVVDPDPSAPLVETTYFPYMDVVIDGNIYSADANGVISTDNNLNGKDALLTFCNFTNDATPLTIEFAKMEWEWVGGVGYGTPVLEPFTTKTKISNNVIQNVDSLKHRIAATHYTSFYKLNDKFLEMDSDFHYLNGFRIFFRTNMNGFVNAGSMRRDIYFYEPFDKKILFGQSPSVLYHELGHSINNLLYDDMGMPDGMVSGALHEGLADLHSAMMLGYQDVFRGEFTDTNDMKTYARYLKNELKLDIDDKGQSHYDGQILSGAMWDFGELTSLELMAKLMHFTRYATPDGNRWEDNRGAFTNWLLQTIITDDDNGNLLALTPHFDEIITAFDNHNITLSLYMKYNYLHTPLPLCTKDSANPYLVRITIPFVNNIKPVEDVYLHWTTDLGVNDSVRMQRDDDEYFAYIPNQPYYSFVNYHFSIHSPFDNKYVELTKTNDGKKYYFFVGYDTMFYDNATTDKGYEFDYTPANNSQNRWQRVNLDTVDRNHFNGTSYYVLPTSDITGDSHCWFVSNMISPFANKPTQRIDSSIMIFSVNANSKFKNYILLNFIMLSSWNGNITRPAFTISIRNGNQDNWKIAFIIATMERNSDEWQEVIFCVNDYLNNFNELQIKITARGSAGLNNEILSCVDNILVLSSDSALSINEYATATIVFPNPTSNSATITMELETAGNLYISLENLSGHHLFELHNSFENAGTFTKEFSFESLPVGTYFIKIEYNGNVRIEKIIRK